ncbi:tetratricopeptide repeat protein [Desulfobacula phenolica]|uniref:Tetratricopeptide repeat-containing protein n=1 Tax=Desulfobacula phenolica TaxID=90732 RepID=A0A1H2HZI6_9BACT|nr:tetratricopeptide repeat protein [Desulfobacula phenolica]SDU37105.1 Tetratricopeptide repeat-containing protein [Desulfobacula phenolica]
MFLIRKKTFFILIVLIFYSVPCSGVQIVNDSIVQPDSFSTDDFSTLEPYIDSNTLAITIAVERLRQGRLKQAFEYAQATLSQNPENISGHGIAGVVLALKGQKEQARKKLKFFKNHKQEIFFPELINAIINAQEGNLKKAEKHLAASLKKQPEHPVALYYKGSLFLTKKQYKSAITIFEKVIRFQPEFVPALAGLGRAFLMLKDVEQAIVYYEKAVTLEPENLLYRRQLLTIYQETDKKELANKQIREMLYYTPGVKQGYLKKGRQLLVMGAYEETATLMDKILNIYKDVPLAFYIKAAAHSNLNQTEEAVNNINNFLDAQQNSAMTHHYAGMCYMVLKQYKKAEDQFIKAISINPNMGKSFVPMIIIEQLNGNFIRALEGLSLAEKGGEPANLIDFLSAHIFLQRKNDPAFFQKMETGVKLIPGLRQSNTLSLPNNKNRDFFAENRNLMVLFFYNGWYGKTLKTSQALLKKNPQDRFALYYKALCETVQNTNMDGISSFNALLKLEKNLYSAHMGLGQLYLKTFDLKNAENAFKKVIDINPSYGPAYAALGDTFQMDDNNEKAIENYQKAIEINPQILSVYPKLIILLSEKKETISQAARYSEKLKTFSPKDPYSIDAIGWISLNLKKTKKGFELIQKAHKLLPNDPIILYHLGIAYYQSKNLKAAEKYLQASIERSNNFPGYNLAMNVLKKIKSD